jgi:hypothetical protein
MSFIWHGLASSPRLRAIRDGSVVAGLLFAAYLFVVLAPRTGTVGADAVAYWRVGQGQPYALGEGITGAFTYPPPAARLFAFASQVSWPAFWWLWMGLLISTLVWLGGRRALVLLAFPPIALELYFGNVNLLIAAAIALGFRYPATWAFVLLTKVTPGVGLVWFAVRREWRSLVIALGISAAIVAASVAIDGPWWRDWIATIVRTAGSGLGGFIPIPLLVRLPLAVILIAWGGLTDRRWTVPVGATLALPVIWVGGLAILAAVAALGRPELRERPQGHLALASSASPALLRTKP